MGNLLIEILRNVDIIRYIPVVWGKMIALHIIVVYYWILQDIFVSFTDNESLGLRTQSSLPWAFVKETKKPMTVYDHTDAILMKQGIRASFQCYFLSWFHKVSICNPVKSIANVWDIYILFHSTELWSWSSQSKARYIEVYRLPWLMFCNSQR